MFDIAIIELSVLWQKKLENILMKWRFTAREAFSRKIEGSESSKITCHLLQADIAGCPALYRHPTEAFVILPS
jgi:hypothetical protein